METGTYWLIAMADLYHAAAAAAVSRSDWQACSVAGLQCIASGALEGSVHAMKQKLQAQGPRLEPAVNDVAGSAQASATQAHITLPERAAGTAVTPQKLLPKCSHVLPPQTLTGNSHRMPQLKRASAAHFDNTQQGPLIGVTSQAAGPAMARCSL